MKYCFTLTLIIILNSVGSFAQTGDIKGQLQDTEQNPVLFANVALHTSVDSNMIKVETTDETGVFNLRDIPVGNYFLVATYVGFSDLRRADVAVSAGEILDLGVLQFSSDALDLDEVTVTAQRAMVEVKADRTVFNVQGTINSVGSDAMELMRKAPGVTVDNNDNISVLGRSGVIIYVDGKRLPLVGDDLSGYLKSLTAEQIDRIDIISNPGAKYEAEGNAGIIDIIFKRDKNLGGNGSFSASTSQGRYNRWNLSGTGNYRSKLVNVFANAGYGSRTSFNDMIFKSKQNGIFLDETNNSIFSGNNLNYRFGTDFYLGKKHILGFLISGSDNDRDSEGENIIKISKQSSQNTIDSVLVAENSSQGNGKQNSYNVNYRYTINKKSNINIDLDYGLYKNRADRFQPNRYYVDLSQPKESSKIVTAFETPTDIEIYTAKVDYENSFAGGKIGLGGKFSQVNSDNTFLVFDNADAERIRNDQNSNQFDYNERVIAYYLTYARPINKKWNFSAGIRAEKTDATGDLTPFIDSLREDPVVLNYWSYFPSAGLTWQAAQMHSFALEYGRRINRPDYNVLNPFRNQLSELSYERGNAFLRPEIVNNLSLGWTYAYRFNFKLAYSKTLDQITRLIGPDEEDPRAGYISWDNLADQTVISFNVSAPMQFGKKWNAYINLSALHLNNQADYGDGAIVDVQAFSYSIYQQHTFDLPWKLKGELSGYFAGPGVWGGVFRYESSWSFNVGLQRKFFNEQLNIRISGNDLFYESGWDGVSEFNGLVSTGSGRNDTRRVSLSLNYNFGNANVKSRKRKTGIEDETKRIKN